MSGPGHRGEGYRAWPPDPPTPWWGWALRRVLARAFDLVGRGGFEVRVTGLEHFTNRPGTIIVSNHKRDVDTILLLPRLYHAHGGRGPVGRIAFVAGETMFEPGYLAGYVLRDCGGWRRWLHGLDLGPVLRGLRAYPVPAARRRKLGSHLRTLRQVVGDVPLSEVLREPVSAVFPGLSPAARIGDVRRWRYREALDRGCGFDVFRPSIARMLRTVHLRAIGGCLDRFAALLAAGDCVFMAPEGELSRTGCLGELRAGLTRVVRRVRREVTLLPVNITYDGMTPGRGRAFIHVGREMRGVQAWPAQQLARAAAGAIASLHTVTFQQVASQVLDRRVRLGRRDWNAPAGLRRQIEKTLRRLHAEGAHVDADLLHAAGFERRWRRFVRYAQGEGILGGPASTHDHAPAAELLRRWAYSVNELESALARQAQITPALER